MTELASGSYKSSLERLERLAHRVGYLEQSVRNAIEAIERGSTTAPVLESLKAALADGEKDQSR